MRPREQAKTPQSDLFRLKLTNLIDLRHELCKLADQILSIPHISDGTQS